MSFSEASNVQPYHINGFKPKESTNFPNKDYYGGVK
jgi:hypothetical protein